MSEKIDLISNPRKSFYNLTTPIVAFTVFSSLYNIIDTLWISGIGLEAVFAIGIASPILTLYYALGDSFGQGTNSIISRYLGSKNYENACSSFIIGSIIIIGVYLLVLLSATEFELIIDFMNIQEENDMILSYLLPMTIFSFLPMFSNFFSETMQAEGNSKLPTITLIGSNIINLILDPILIYGLDLGISGAAYSSIISALISFIILSYWYASKRTKIKFKKKYFKIRLYVIYEILKVSVPNSFEDVMSSFTSIFINYALIEAIGPYGPGIYIILNSIKNFCLSPIKGYGRGLLSMSGHLFGAKKFDDIKELYIFVLKLGIITSLVIGFICFILQQPILNLYDIDEELDLIFEIATGGIIILMFSSVVLISGKLLDGFGKSYYALLFNILKKVFQIIFMVIIVEIIDNELAILLPLMFSEIIFAFVYYIFTNKLLRKSKNYYRDKEVVKSF